MLFFGQRGYRVIAHDRCGHGRSDQPWGGYTMEQFGDDLADLLDTLDLRDVVLVAHSMGGGEVSKYISRHGTSRLARVVLVSAVPPLMVKTAANPHGTLSHCKFAPRGETEGDNQKQADFLAACLAKTDPKVLHDLHVVQSGIVLPEHIDLFDKGGCLPLAPGVSSVRYPTPQGYGHFTDDPVRAGTILHQRSC
jgi:pimeloyl-ACP methyl ester carboxylesterase